SAVCSSDLNLREGHLLGRIKHTQTETGVHQPCERRIDLRLTDHLLPDCPEQCLIGPSAIQFGAVFYAQGSGSFSRKNDLMVEEDIFDGVAVGHHVTVKTPILAQDVDQQALAG